MVFGLSYSFLHLNGAALKPRLQDAHLSPGNRSSSKKSSISEESGKETLRIYISLRIAGKNELLKN